MGYHSGARLTLVPLGFVEDCCLKWIRLDPSGRPQSVSPGQDFGLLYGCRLPAGLRSRSSILPDRIKSFVLNLAGSVTFSCRGPGVPRTARSVGILPLKVYFVRTISDAGVARGLLERIALYIGCLQWLGEDDLTSSQ